MIYAIGIFIILFTIIFTMNIKDDKLKELNKKNGILFYSNTVKYLGGFGDIYGQVDRYITINLTEEKLNMDFKTFNKDIKVIDIKDIMNVYTTTEENISKEISLGKLIVFGFYGLGMQKQHKEVKRCLVITYNDKVFNRESNIILESCPDKLAEKIIEIKSKNNLKDENAITI